jgi:ribosome-associated protein YbcJ (S4-like RNA binding protein)
MELERETRRGKKIERRNVVELCMQVEMSEKGFSEEE